MLAIREPQTTGGVPAASHTWAGFTQDVVTTFNKYSAKKLGKYGSIKGALSWPAMLCCSATCLS